MAPLTPPKVIDIDDPLQPRREPEARATPARRPPAAFVPELVEEQEAAQALRHEENERDNQGDPYDGSPKVAVSMRATKELWDRLGVLSRRLEDEGLRTSRTELTEALWHFHAPATPDDARELVLQYRRARLG